MADGVGKLPEELLDHILHHLPTKWRLLAGFTCTKWMRLIALDYSRVTDLRLIFEDGFCSPQVQIEPLSGAKNGSFILCLTLCQCLGHVDAHCQMLWFVLSVVGSHLRQVMVEDYLVKPDSYVQSQTLDVLLESCQSKLECFEMHNVDVSMVSPNTFLKIGRLRQLSQLSFCHCDQRLSHPKPRLLTDRILSSIVNSTKTQTLRQIRLTGNAYVSDRFLKHLSRSCPKLWFADLSGCKEVTARGVAHFCETLSWRDPDMLYLKLSQTDVRGGELQMYLFCPYSPVFKQGRWKITDFHVEFSGWKKAACVHNTELPTKTVVLFA